MIGVSKVCPKRSSLVEGRSASMYLVSTIRVSKKYLVKESALPASHAFERVESAGAGPGCAGAWPLVEEITGDSLVRAERIIGSERAARDAEDAFTKDLRESLLFFISGK